MEIAELFVNLGVKGDGTLKKALVETKSGLGEAKDMSLEMKAGILGAMYALEQFMSKSMAAGNGIMQFSNYTGMSTDMLQRWQYLLRQSGVGAEEATSSLEGLQKIMYQMRAGLSNPAGSYRVSEVLGGNIDWDKAKNDMGYMMDKLREYARLETDIPRRNDVLSSFNMSHGMIGSLATSKVDLNKISPGEMYSKGQSESLQKAGVAWANMWNHVEKSLGKFNAKHGPALATQISAITDQVLKMLEAFDRLAEKLEIFKLIGEAFKGWGLIFDGINSVVGKVADASSKDGVAKGLGKSAMDGYKNLVSGTTGIGASIGQVIGSSIKQQMITGKENEQKFFHPSAPKVPSNQQHHSTTKHQKVSVNIHGIPDAVAAIPDIKKAVSDAYFQNGSLVVG